MYTTNVVSVEIIDACLLSKSKNKQSFTVNPRLEVDLYYKSTPLEVALFRHVLPLHIMKILLLGRF